MADGLSDGGRQELIMGTYNSGEARKIEGTLVEIFSDDGSGVLVKLLLKDGTRWTADASAYPVSEEDLRGLIGRRIRLTTSMEFLDE